jgi:hypothetical protein
VSTVTYLTDTGGPTLIFNQTTPDGNRDVPVPLHPSCAPPLRTPSCAPHPTALAEDKRSAQLSAQIRAKIHAKLLA